jgi:hypothetical protein
VLYQNSSYSDLVSIFFARLLKCFLNITADYTTIAAWQLVSVTTQHYVAAAACQLVVVTQHCVTKALLQFLPMRLWHWGAILILQPISVMLDTVTTAAQQIASAMTWR